MIAPRVPRLTYRAASSKKVRDHAGPILQGMREPEASLRADTLSETVRILRLAFGSDRRELSAIAGNERGGALV
jgi:hypothetical protein